MSRCPWITTGHYHGYAKRYKAFRWLPNHPVVSETRSKQTVIRNL